MSLRRYCSRAGFASVLLLILLLSAMLALPTAANMVKGSLELSCSVKRDGKTVTLADDEYALSQVAQVKNTQDGLMYQTLPAYAAADCDWTKCSTAQLRDKAKQLVPMVQEKADFAAIQKTDEKGVATFHSLTPGLYLVTRTKTAPKNTEYAYEPFLLSVPTVINEKPVYHVVAEPKYSWDADTKAPIEPAVPQVKPNPNPKPLPQTGQLWWPLPLMTALGVLFLAAALVCRRCTPSAKRKWQILLFGLGALFLSASCGLYLFNVMDSNRAGTMAQDALNQMADEKIELSDDAADREMPVKIVDGIAYIGTLNIPSLELELPVISEWSYPSLKIAPCRYTGTVYQDNMILCAHDYSTHFGKLARLQVGDEVVFTDVEDHIYTYQMTAQEIIPMSNPESMEKGDWDLTLFTCTRDGKSRVTVRLAKEK